MYTPKHFSIEELVPPQMTHIDKNVISTFFDDRALKTIDMLRDRYGPVIINDWKFGGSNYYRGFRPYTTSIGAEYSQHRLGRAFDCKFKYISVEEVRNDIKFDPFKREFQHITCIEDNVSWLHFDVRNWNKKLLGLLVVKP
jgi:hypothetical protein